MHRALTSLLLSCLFACATLGAASSASADSDALSCSVAELGSEGDFEIAHAKALVSRTGKQMVPRTTGVQLVIPAKPAMTQQWLEHVVACRLAQYDVMRTRGPTAAASHDPLAVEGTKVRVVALRGAFAIEITSDKASVVREVMSRAQQAVAGDARVHIAKN